MWFHPAHRVAAAQFLSPRARDAASGVSDCPCSLSFAFPARSHAHPCTSRLSHPLDAGPRPRTPCLFLLVTLAPAAEPGGPCRSRRAPSLAQSSLGVRPTPTLPLLSCLSVQFLLDGKVLSLTDFQVGVMGVPDRASREWFGRVGREDARCRKLGSRGTVLPVLLARRPWMSWSWGGRAEVLLRLRPLSPCCCHTQTSTSSEAPPPSWPVGSTTETSGGADLSDSLSSGGIVAPPPIRKFKVNSVLGCCGPGAGPCTRALGCEGLRIVRLGPCLWVGCLWQVGWEA